MRGPRGGRRPLLLLVLIAIALVVVLAALFTVGPLAHRGEGPPFTGKLNTPLGGRRYRVTAWITAGAPTLQAALKPAAIDEVDADWYMSQADGTVTAGRDEDLALVKPMRKDGLQVFATVTNRATDRSSFDGKIAGAVLASPESRARQVQALVDLAVTKGYDGIDLDWEMVPVADRDAFSAFATELAAALHQQRRLLSVAVFPKTSEPGDWDTQKASDYAALGKAVDEFKVMTYSFSGPWSGPGPQAPLDWTARVLTFAQSVVPARKIYMGTAVLRVRLARRHGHRGAAGPGCGADRQGALQGRARRGLRRGRPELHRRRRGAARALFPGPTGRRSQARQPDAGISRRSAGFRSGRWAARTRRSGG